MCLYSRYVGGGISTSRDNNPSWYDFIAGANAATLPSGVSFTRASSATRRNSSALIVTETTDVPLWQFNISGVARGLRAIGAGTNTCKQGTTITGTSAQFGAVRATFNANTVTSPDGTTNAGKLVEDSTASNTHQMATSTLSGTAGTVYTLSCYAKAAERTWFILRVIATEFLATSAAASFNLGTGAIGTVNAGLTAGIEDAGSGWYRCWVTFTSANTTAIGGCGLHAATADNTFTYTGDGVSGLYLWGCQFEAGDGPSSFIPTTTASVTRAADVPLITATNALVDQCWVIRARTALFSPGAGGFQTLFAVDDGTTSNRRYIYRDPSNNIIFRVDTAGALQASLTLGTVANDTDFVLAVRSADNNFAGSLNGAAIVTDLSGTHPLGATTARIGYLHNSSTVAWQSTVKTIETRRTASDTELPLLAS